MCDQHPPFSPSIVQLVSITRHAKTSFDRRTDVDPVLAQCARDVRVDVFVEMKPDPFSHGSVLAVLLQRRGIRPAKRLDECLVFLDSPIDLVPMIVVVGHGRKNRS